MPDTLATPTPGRDRERGAGRASDVLHARLAALITTGELARGARLPPERELMRRFEVSRPVVREAIATLAHQGLVRTRPRCRPVVGEPDYERALSSLGRLVGHLASDEEGVRNLFETRVFFEAALARWAALHARREDIRELLDRLERNRAAIGVRGSFEATDAAFHQLLYLLPRNPVYPAVHRAYVDWLGGHWRRIEGTPEIDAVNHAGHEAIGRAIVERDPDGAEEALRRHLTGAWEYVRATFFPARSPGPEAPARRRRGRAGGEAG